MSPILEPGTTCWRIERADRLAFLIDTDVYFTALHRALGAARESVWMLGWDVDRRTRLIHDESGDPPELGPWLDELARRHRALRVNVLCWGGALIYALERPWLVAQRWKLEGHRRVRFRADCQHPRGASHHQKVVVIDDAMAFVGGIDVTTHRWDAPEHMLDDPRRTLPNGELYPPFHDVQAAVSGPIAATFGELARQRWQLCNGETHDAPRRPPGPDPWPASLAPWLEDVPVAILRTQSAHDGMERATEIAAFMERALASAERSIFIETPYLTSRAVTAALCRRLGQRDGPEIVIVTSERGDGWLEHQTLDALRGEVVATLRAADQYGRLRIYFPRLAEGTRLTLHSKTMVVDDALVRVGSANLTNRSLWLDTEFDIAVEAGGRRDVCEAAARFRRTLLGEHLGMAPAELEAAERTHGSMIAVLDRCAGTSMRTLMPIHAAPAPEIVLGGAVGALADPLEPIDGAAVVRELLGPDQHRRLPRRALAFAALVVVLLGVAAAWQLTDMGDEAARHATTWLERAPHSAPLLALTVVAFALLTSLGVPVTVAIGVSALTLGTWAGFTVATLGSFLSAAIGYGVGRGLGGDAVERMPGRSFRAVRHALKKRGIISVLALRVVPVAPFWLVNLAAGAAGVRLRDYALGTVLGMAPGILGLSVLIDRIVAALRSPSPLSFAALAVLLGILALLSVGLARWAKRRKAPGYCAAPVPSARKPRSAGEPSWPRLFPSSKSTSRAKTSSSQPSRS